MSLGLSGGFTGFLAYATPLQLPLTGISLGSLAWLHIHTRLGRRLRPGQRVLLWAVTTGTLALLLARWLLRTAPGGEGG